MWKILSQSDPCENEVHFLGSKAVSYFTSLIWLFVFPAYIEPGYSIVELSLSGIILLAAETEILWMLYPVSFNNDVETQIYSGF